MTSADAKPIFNFHVYYNFKVDFKYYFPNATFSAQFFFLYNKINPLSLHTLRFEDINCI